MSAVAADYTGPVRLNPIKWGRRDRDTARVLFWSAQRVNPPTVIPWHPHEPRTLRCLHHNRAPIE